MRDEEENLTIEPVVCLAVVQQYSIRQKGLIRSFQAIGPSFLARSQSVWWCCLAGRVFFREPDSVYENPIGPAMTKVLILLGMEMGWPTAFAFDLSWLWTQPRGFKVNFKVHGSTQFT